MSADSLLKRYAPVAMLLAVSASLQGCFLGEVLAHPTPAWTQKPNYNTQFQYIPEGHDAKTAVKNSCNIPDLPVRKQCSGNGYCDVWRKDLLTVAAESGQAQQPQRYCKCFRDWADPECRTRRKSQQIAYVLSLFGGYLGLDHFYLEQYYTACLKLATLGGVGIWWICDIVRIGCAPMYVGSHDWRLAYDLPHWVFVLSSVFFFMALGYFIFGVVLQAYRIEKSVSKQLMHAEEEFHKTRSAAVAIPPMDTVGWPTYQSYGVPLSGYGAAGMSPAMAKAEDRFQYWPPAIWQNVKKAWRPTNMFDGSGRPLKEAMNQADVPAWGGQSNPQGFAL